MRLPTSSPKDVIPSFCQASVVAFFYPAQQSKGSDEEGGACEGVCKQNILGIS